MTRLVETSINVSLLVLAVLMVVISVGVLHKLNHADELRVIPNWTSITGGKTVLGSDKSRVRIFEFSDFQCPFCKKLDPWLIGYISKQSDVELVSYELPLSNIHPFAYLYAEASWCAGRGDGYIRFREMLFAAGQGCLGKEDIVRLASTAGIKDIVSFSKCIDGAPPRRLLNGTCVLQIRLE